MVKGLSMMVMMAWMVMKMGWIMFQRSPFSWPLKVVEQLWVRFVFIFLRYEMETINARYVIPFEYYKVQPSDKFAGPVQSNKIVRVDAEGTVYCYHDMVAVKRIASIRSSRPGQEFFGCPLWPKMDCRFFVWKDELEVTCNDGANTKLLEMKNKALELKINNLELEKMILVEENKKLKLKLAMANCPMMKYLILCVVIVFVILFLFK